MNMQIQSVGPPPELHADRVVGEMMRHLAEQRADMWEQLSREVTAKNDATPAQQKRLEARIRNLGVMHTKLKTGKRGKYEMEVFDMSGWDQWRDAAIKPLDVVPERPWLALWWSRIVSSGNGRGVVDMKGGLMALVTHHALSRAAQRFGARTVKDMIVVADAIHVAVLKLIADRGNGWWKTPSHGVPVPLVLSPVTAVVVVKQHETRKCLIAVTVHGEP